MNEFEYCLIYMLCKINSIVKIYFTFDFSFGMYTSTCLFLVLSAAAAAAQHFWNDNEFCQNLNSRNAKQSLVGGVTDVSIPSIKILRLRFNKYLDLF